ncbi:lipopolysaccharide export system permease protein [Parabacteroides sp. PFB2-12]|nr:lipopolysaccharide export system permease protein [Parabacteroides sp. PM6-13]MDH6389241.1 lipopolysaccharide export system permease protein [Parabacteroides sp. PFB2-12]
MTFGICLFIVLMQFLWRFIDDLVGKGLEMSVLGEMFLYAALSLVPMALPLAILLASLMTFGNLGERLELLAMKSAGVSLIHIMRPLMVLIVAVSIGAFFFQNNAMPVIQVKLYTLLSSIRNKSPELEIPEGSFYKEITNFNVYVKEKDKKTGLLKDMMIYDYSNGFNNARVILADSGRLKTSDDKLFLVLTMYDGESFENMRKQTSNRGQTAVPYRRETFKSKEVLIEFDANFNRYDESLMANMYVGKDLNDLQLSIDSMSVRLDSINTLNARTVYSSSYKRSFNQIQYANTPEEEKKEIDFKEFMRSDEVRATEAAQINFDTYYAAQSPSGQATILNRVKNSIDNTRTDYMFRATNIGTEASTLRRHKTEWHKKFTLSVACLLFFFIGAPLGAIIRKGGLGVPVIISVLLFIFYYIIDNIGFKMAKEGVWDAWQGMWLSTAVLAPMGIFLTYKAVNDSVILNADTYINALKNLIGKRSDRKVDMKEVIIYAPDYQTASVRLQQLIADCTQYLSSHKRWVNYFSFWKQGGKDPSARRFSDEVESLVEELGNSDQILIINKLMDYPIMTGYYQMNVDINPTLGLIVALLFPIGGPLYLLATYKRRLLNHDVKVVQRTSEELLSLITSH